MSKANNQFRLSLPDGWEDQSAYTFVGPEVNGHRHLVTLVIDNHIGDHTLDSFARTRIEVIQASLPPFETLKEAQRTLPSGLPIYEWIYKTVPVDGKAIFHKNVYLIIGKQGFTFSAIFTKMSFKTIGVEVERLIDSFVPMS